MVLTPILGSKTLVGQVMRMMEKDYRNPRPRYPSLESGDHPIVLGPPLTKLNNNIYLGH